MVVDDLKMRVTPDQFAQLIINALGLPKTCTDIRIHMRSGEPTTVLTEHVLMPLTVEGETVKTVRSLLIQETRMTDWWRNYGWRLYR